MEDSNTDLATKLVDDNELNETIKLENVVQLAEPKIENKIEAISSITTEKEIVAKIASSVRKISRFSVCPAAIDSNENIIRRNDSQPILSVITDDLITETNNNSSSVNNFIVGSVSETVVDNKENLVDLNRQNRQIVQENVNTLEQLKIELENITHAVVPSKLKDDEISTPQQIDESSIDDSAEQVYSFTPENSRKTSTASATDSNSNNLQNIEILSKIDEPIKTSDTVDESLKNFEQISFENNPNNISEQTFSSQENSETIEVNFDDVTTKTTTTSTTTFSQQIETTQNETTPIITEFNSMPDSNTESSSNDENSNENTIVDDADGLLKLQRLENVNTLEKLKMELENITHSTSKSKETVGDGGVVITELETVINLPDVVNSAIETPSVEYNPQIETPKGVLKPTRRISRFSVVAVQDIKPEQPAIVAVEKAEAVIGMFFILFFIYFKFRIRSN